MLEGEAKSESRRLARGRRGGNASAGCAFFIVGVAEAERGLAHVVLSDLFEGVLGEVLPSLSAPRRHALEVALLLDEASEQPVEPRTLGVAVRTALQALAEETPGS